MLSHKKHLYVIVAFLLILPLFLLSSVATAGSKLKKSDARVTIVVTDFEGTPLEGARLELDRIDDSGHFEGKTNKKGQFIVVLSQGARFEVACIYAGKTFRFGAKEIPKVGGPLNYALNLSIKERAQGQAVDPRSNAKISTMARTKVTVVNSLGQPEPDAVVSFKAMDGGESYTGRTDSSGLYRLEMPRGKTFDISCDKYGVVFELGPHPIPDVDSFILNLKLIIERSVFAQAEASPKPVAAKEETTTIVTVRVYDQHSNPESEAQLTFMSTEDGQSIKGKTDSAGRYILLLPPGNSYQLDVSKYNKTHDAGFYTIPSSDTFEIPVELRLASKYLETYRLENVYFDTAKTTLRPESFPPLDELVDVLQKNPTMVIELAGHTDSRGKEIYNLNLSRGRANSVRDYVINKGIDPARLAAKGYGEFEAIAPNDTTEGMQLNRRTEVRVISR